MLTTDCLLFVGCKCIREREIDSKRERERERQTAMMTIMKKKKKLNSKKYENVQKEARKETLIRSLAAWPSKLCNSLHTINEFFLLSMIFIYIFIHLSFCVCALLLVFIWHDYLLIIYKYRWKKNNNVKANGKG